MRRLAITKNVSLEGVADGWGSDCFALVTPASYAEYVDFSAMKDKSELEAVSYLIDFVKKHLVSGKVNVFDEDGKTVLDDLLPEDVEASKDLADKLFSEIVGVSLDPKALPTATVTSPTSADTNAL